MNIPIRQVINEAAGLRRVQWDERKQDADEARRMRAYVRFAERHAGASPVPGICKTCAFRSGTEANGSGAVLDMIENECLALGAMFNCHAGAEINPANGCLVEDTEPGIACRGYLALMSENYRNFAAEQAIIERYPEFAELFDRAAARPPETPE